jgi:hypothetical protein
MRQTVVKDLNTADRRENVEVNVFGPVDRAGEVWAA